MTGVQTCALPICAKLDRKRLDLIAANAVGPGQGFDTELNQLELLWPGGGVSLELAPKDKLARQLIGIVAERWHVKNSHPARLQ